MAPKDTNHELAEARERLDHEYRQVQERLGEVHVAFDAVVRAGPEDNLHDLLETLENKVKEARDGGVFGSGANGHRRALEHWRKLSGRPST